MNPKTRALRARTAAFRDSVIQFVESLPDTPITERIVPQLLDSAGSTDSNYRAACRARSRKEFIAKMGVAAEEADETMGWLEALAAANLGAREQTRRLIDEADQLTAIFVASQKTAKRNDEKPRRPSRRS